MTTVLADHRLRCIVADSAVSDEGERVWKMRKVHRIRGELVAFAGALAECRTFIDWYRHKPETPPDFTFKDSSALVLRENGLFLFDEDCIELTKVTGGREAIGTGSVAAIAAYEALGWTDPQKAVRIACHHDLKSRPPVRTYRL